MTFHNLYESFKKHKILSISCDSRKVKSGDAFFALAEEKAIAISHVKDACGKGASIIVGRESIRSASGDIPFISVDNPRSAWSKAQAILNPKCPETILAVTGSNGKTSVAWMVKDILTSLGVKAGYIGTLGVFPDVGIQSGLTTPDAEDLHEILSKFADLGITHAVIEASSHGLQQRRLDGLSFRASAFTNLSHDHLDYHKTIENYFSAKAILFDELTEGVSILNGDVSEYNKLLALSSSSMSYSRENSTMDLYLEKSEPNKNGITVSISYQGKTYHGDLAMMGDFQGLNLMAAMGLVMACGYSMDDVWQTLTSLNPIPGRMEMVHKDPTIIVDYAHTPDALEKALMALRPHTERHLYLIFGCGGDRDQEKRPMMGAIATRLADRVIVTDDNPRNENAKTIRDSILSTAPKAMEIPDRGEAITTAIDVMGDKDVLLIAGKGHEQGQIVGDKVIPFDDREVAASYVQEREGKYELVA